MENARRWYIYLISAVSLNSILWAAITLFRTLFSTSVLSRQQDLALTFAILIIGIPVYLLHWRAAQSGATENKEERGAFQRSLYLYAALSFTLGPVLANLFSLVLRGILDRGANAWSSSLPVILVMAASFAYHYLQLKADQQSLGGEASPELRRLYHLGFLSAGLVMLVSAGMALIGWILYRLPPTAPSFSLWTGQIENLGLQALIVRLLFGLGIFVYFWRVLDQLFASSREEQASLLRAVYLYLVVFIATITTVSTASVILAGFLRSVLGLSSRGDLRETLPVLIIFGGLWAFLALVLQRGQPASLPQASQARARSMYYYLVAAVGFGALLVGLVGDIHSVLSGLLIDSLGTIATTTRAGFANFTATLLAGLATWVIPWRIVQDQAEDEGEAGAHSRRGWVRKAYLYFFLLVSMLALLGSLISILYQTFLLILGENAAAQFLRELVLPISDIVVATGVLVYHGWLLRGDQRRQEAEKTAQLKDLRLAILDDGDGSLAAALQARLAESYPGLDAAVIGLSADAKKALGTKLTQAGILGRIKGSRLIIAPWSAATPDGANAKVAQAIAESGAHKLLIPQRREAVDWVGLPALSDGDAVSQSIAALKQYLEGEEVIARRPLGCLAIFGIIMLGLIALSVLSSLAFG